MHAVITPYLSERKVEYSAQFEVHPFHKSGFDDELNYK